MAKAPTERYLPDQPIDRIVQPIERFFHVEAASGVVLVLATVAALVLANSPWSSWFLDIWTTDLSLGVGSFQMSHSLKHWINDGLMAVFFFVIGLEVKRELVVGELRELRAAALPIAGAIGGMVVPAGVYLALQAGEPTARGWGIPMATDIAFVVGCLAVLGSRVPKGLRVMLLSLAIADDIGAILVIAVGYTAELDTTALGLGVAGLALVHFATRLGIRSSLVYWLLGASTWVAFHESGVHATIAGVALGLMTPACRYAPSGMIGAALDRARDVFHGGDWDQLDHRAARVQKFQKVVRESVSPLEYLESALHPWVAFGIMPLFALANAGVPLRAEDLVDPVGLSIGAGLVIGKPVGVLLFSVLIVKTGIARLPDGVTWRHVLGGGCLAGIGFTMALFIAGLAIEGPALDGAKVGILGASVVAAVLGMTILMRSAAEPAR